MSDPTKGITLRSGRIEREELRAFVDSLRRIGLGDVEQQVVADKRQEAARRRLCSDEGGVIFIADGGDYSFDIDAHGLRFRFEGNAIPQYAEAYPDIAEYQLLVRAIEIFEAFTGRLWGRGLPAREHAERLLGG